MNYITADIATKSHLERLGRRLKFILWPSVDNPFCSSKEALPEHCCVVSRIKDEHYLNALIRKNPETVIDVNAPDESVFDFFENEKKEPSAAGEFGLLLTCPVLFACDVAFIFARELRRRNPLISDSQAEDIQMVVHESLVNGLIHGNLQLSSELKQSARDYIEYSRLLKERLNNPLYARKCIGMKASWNKQNLIIKIRDEGQGFPTLTALQIKPPCLSKTGRGLKIIAGAADSCVLSDFGREIRLGFLLKKGMPKEKKVFPEQSQADVFKTPDLSICRVLLVDGENTRQVRLKELLNSIGIRRTDAALTSEQGLQLAMTKKPDLIILDRSLLFSGATSFIGMLKSHPFTHDIPVIVQTDTNTQQIRDRIFSAGAVDFITRPINPLQFFSRVKVHLDNRLLIKNLETQLDVLEGELRTAQSMQMNMLPSGKLLRHIRKSYHLDIAHSFVPSSSLGGDFWQIFEISPSKVGLYLSDFSGHGVAAALNTFRLHTLIAQAEKSKLTSPAFFLKTLNRQLYHLLPRGQFATFFCMIIDVKKHIMRYAGAGCVPPLAEIAGQEKVLMTKGLPLGISEQASYTDHEISFLPGDQIILISDALTEAEFSDKKRVGYPFMANLIRNCWFQKESRSALKMIMTHFFELTPSPPADDATAVLVKFEKHEKNVALT